MSGSLAGSLPVRAASRSAGAQRPAGPGEIKGRLLTGAAFLIQGWAMLNRIRSFAERHTEVSIYLTAFAGLVVAGAFIVGRGGA